MWEHTAPGTKFTYDFCAGIGPLQLGVVLVFFIVSIIFFSTFHTKTKM